MNFKYLTPPYIHQIFINDDDELPEFPTIIQENIRSTQVCYPNAVYRLWTLSELDDFIQENFDGDVLWAFRLLVPFAYKSDLARLCLIYIYGGLYVDLGVRLIQPIELPEKFGLLAFRDMANSVSVWTSIINGIIWAREPKREEIMLYIRRIVQNCKDQYYGENSLYPTGPVLFGQCVTEVMSKNKDRNPYEFYIGDTYPCSRDIYTSLFLTKYNQTFALIVKSLSHSNISEAIKSNSYGSIWSSKRVYGEKEMIFEHESERILVSGESVVKDEQGIYSLDTLDKMLCFGPYIDLEKGGYLFELSVECGENKEGAGVIVETVCNFGQTIIDKQVIEPQNFQLPIKIVLHERCKKVEFRLYSRGGFNGIIKGYKIIEV